jgi:hypothetical protein
MILAIGFKGSSSSFHPEMALFCDFNVNLRDSWFNVLQYASAYFLDFLELG